MFVITHFKKSIEFIQMEGTNSYHPPDFQGQNKTTKHKYSKQSLERTRQMQTVSQNRKEKKKGLQSEAHNGNCITTWITTYTRTQSYSIFLAFVYIPKSNQ